MFFKLPVQMFGDRYSFAFVHIGSSDFYERKDLNYNVGR